MPSTTVILGFRADALAQGLTVLLQEQLGSYSIVAHCKTGSRLVDAARSFEPDLIIMTPGLKDVSSVDAIEKIQAASPDILILILARSSEYHLLHQYLDMGVRGFIPQTTALPLIAKAAALVVAGGFVTLPPITETLFQTVLLRSGYRSRYEQIDIGRLTPREKEVFRLVGSDMTNREIAEALFISINTVKVHIGNIMAKTGIHHRDQLTDLHEYIVRVRSQKT